MILSKLKPLVNDPLLWKAFEEYIETKIVLAYSSMEKANEPRDFYREQGKVELLKRLQKLKDEVNGADKQPSLFK